MVLGNRAPTGDRHPGAVGRVVVRAGVLLLAAAAAITGLMWLWGSLLVHGSTPAFLRHMDIQTTDWAVEHRTPTLDTMTHIGSMMADTIVALVVTAVAVVVLRIYLGRWRESIVIVVAILGELLIFLAITATVHRARPSVPQLDQAPPTSSFPSGHTGAAIALYACLAVICLRNLEPRWLAVSLAMLGFATPVIVAASRVYRGMHYLTDVLAGMLAGGVWLAVVLLVLLRTRSTGEASSKEKERPPPGPSPI